MGAFKDNLLQVFARMDAILGENSPLGEPTGQRPGLDGGKPQAAKVAEASDIRAIGPSNNRTAHSDLCRTELLVARIRVHHGRQGRHSESVLGHHLQRRIERQEVDAAVLENPYDVLLRRQRDDDETATGDRLGQVLRHRRPVVDSGLEAQADVNADPDAFRRRVLGFQGRGRDRQRQR